MESPVVAFSTLELAADQASDGVSEDWSNIVERIKQSGSVGKIFSGFKVESPTSLVSIVGMSMLETWAPMTSASTVPIS